MIAAGLLAGFLFSACGKGKPAPAAVVEIIPQGPFQRLHRLPKGPRTGWLERVLVCPGGHPLVAKIDTGATSSSIHAAEYKLVKRDGRTYVHFSAPDRDGVPYSFERELVRMTRVKRPGGKIKERPVVTLGIVLGDTYHETEVSLEDRSHLNYRLLLGRAYQRQAGLVINPSSTFRTKPNPALAVPAP